jgi:hypothetical protein
MVPSVSVAAVVLAPSKPPAAISMSPMFVPPGNERATFNDGWLDHVFEPGL